MWKKNKKTDRIAFEERKNDREESKYSEKAKEKSVDGRTMLL